MVVQTQTERLKQIRSGVMELYISDHPLDCLTCAANGDCELQDMAGAVGLRDVRYGYDGENHTKHGRRTKSNPYFTFDPSKCIVCSRCVRACEEVQGTFALTIEGRGFEFARSRPAWTSLSSNSECVSCGACVQACPTATLSEKTRHRDRPARAFGGHDLRLLRRRLLASRPRCAARKLVRMVPYKDGKANRGHSCVKGRFAWGYATHKDRILKPMIREKITDPWREVTWEEAIERVAVGVPAHPGQVRPAARSAASPRRAAPTRRPTSSRSWCAAASATTTSIPAPASAIRRPATASGPTFGTSAGTQDFDSVEHTDVVLIIGANPTDGHPVFASRMKKRLRQGAKLIVIDPRRIDMVRIAARRGAVPSAAAARHQRRRC